MSITRLALRFAAPLPELLSFQRYLFIGPHPDDIEIGAGATAAAMRMRGEIGNEMLRLDFPGGELQVSLSVEEDAVCDIYLTGPAIVVAEGEYIGS